MSNILISPSKYVQGSNELSNIGKHVNKLGKKALVLITKSGHDRIGNIVDDSLSLNKVEYVIDYFNGECSRNEINRLVDIAKNNKCNVIIGIGGGKILDTAKAVAYYIKKPVVICPTIASTDAPCSALSVLYTDEGVFDTYLFLPANPNVVIMDTTIISNSPARLIVAGMGDALATYFEARATKQSNGSTCAGGKPTLAAMELAKLCYNTLIDEGLKAKLALEAKVCTTSVENIIEANTLLSGIGFESGGLAAAHAIHNGFTVLEECHHMYHGEKVAFGTLTQLVLENSDNDEINEVIDFLISVDLPVTLKQLGIKEVTKEKIMQVAMAASVPGETIHNMPFEVTVDKVYAAIMAADALGRYYLDLD
ncbi:MAG: glycerol dehydrogenase [Erysipelotrichaceae bacterium]